MDAAKQETRLERTVDDVFLDFRGRRKGLIKSLTTHFEEFYHKCDSEKDFLCLYGLPNGSWELIAPLGQVAPELPEPILGINIGKEGMHTSEWLSLVAVHSDAWLMSLAFFFAGVSKFDKDDRKRLFRMINGLPTIFEVINAKHPTEPEQLSTDKQNENQTQLSDKMVEISNTGPSAKMPQSGTFALDVGSSVPLDSSNEVLRGPSDKKGFHFGQRIFKKGFHFGQRIFV